MSKIGKVSKGQSKLAINGGVPVRSLNNRRQKWPKYTDSTVAQLVSVLHSDRWTVRGRWTGSKPKERVCRTIEKLLIVHRKLLFMEQGDVKQKLISELSSLTGVSQNDVSKVLNAIGFERGVQATIIKDQMASNLSAKNIRIGLKVNDFFVVLS